MLQAALRDVRRQLRQVQRRAAKQKQRAKKRKDMDGLRCAPSAPACLVVLVCSGGLAEVAAEFVLGRGWLKRKGRVLQYGDMRKLEVDIEAAYDALPLSKIQALRQDPVKAGLISGAQMLAIVRWLVERSLRAWVECQNQTHGVAPSRAQLVEHALSAMPACVPGVWRQEARSQIAASERRQRKWLALFRLRWGLRLGKLQLRSHLSMKEKRAKDGFWGAWASLILVVFGKA